MAINDDDPKDLSSDKTGGFAASDPQAARNQGGSQNAASEIEKKLMSAAEELGTWLGTAERKTTEFLGQQKAITEQLVRIRDTAAKLVAQIEKGRERSR